MRFLLPRGPVRGLVTGITLSAALAFASSEARAYCRTSVCDGVTGQRCEPSAPGDCGEVIAWPSACVGLSVQVDGSAQLDVPTTQSVFQAAFDTWSAADCAGLPPAIRVLGLEPVRCDATEYNQDQGNANVVLFRDEAWPHEGQLTTIALTTVTYDLDTADIYDADIELNTAQFTFSAGPGATGALALAAVATHEAGHFLGLAHSAASGSTMLYGYAADMDTLSEDDVSAICAVYPPADEGDCDPTPRHGFQSECAVPGSEGPREEGCSCELPGPGRKTPAGLGFFVVAWGIVLCHRRGGRRSSAPPPRETPAA